MQLALIVCVAACWPPPALALRLPLGPWSGRVGTGGIASTVGAPGAPIVPIASRGLRRFQPKLGFYEAVELMDKSVQVVKRIPKFDCSSGAGRLSVPQQHLASVLDDAGRAERDRTGMPPVGPLLRAHQVGKKAVGQLPDAALLGALVLVSNELIKREYTSKFTALSPYIRDLANSTLAELNTKLETLSELEWYDIASPHRKPMCTCLSRCRVLGGASTSCNAENSEPNPDPYLRPTSTTVHTIYTHNHEGPWRTSWRKRRTRCQHGRWR